MRALVGDEEWSLLGGNLFQKKWGGHIPERLKPRSVHLFKFLN
jgi:hypothetical protein